MLNVEQQKAYVKVLAFLNDPNQKYMNISGGAGTGKTYFISQVADSILRHKPKNSPLNKVVVTATTNKAVAVISQAVGLIVGDIKTTHSFMNLRVSENYNTGEQRIVPTKNWTIHSGIFLIVDEASMVNKKLFEYIQVGLDNTCKVLFVGDKNQLAPVKEDISPVYKNNFDTIELINPVRNSNQPALIALCEQAKQMVLTNIFTPIKEVPGVIDFASGNILRGILEREYCIADPYKRVLSYTNNKVIQYNQFIRTLRGYSKPYEIGEIVSNNEATELQNKTTLYTDQILRIHDIISNQDSVDIIRNHSIPTITLSLQDVMTGHIYVANVFKEIGDRNNVLQHYASKADWNNYFKIKNTMPDLRAVAASTIHKAQGSTYDSVIVDLADIGTCTNKDQTARMIYVALSRAKNRVFIKGRLPDRYF